jgi:predicted O-methyltransferase YrrM
VPQDLRVNPAPWARVLVSLYDDHASWPSSIVPEGGMLLHALVRNIRPRVVVETGTCLGASTIWLASALREAGGVALHTFDLFRPPPEQRLAESPLFHERRRGVEARLGAAGLADIVHIHEGDSVTQLAAARAHLRSLGGVQLAFIDGDHSPKGALADLQAVEPVLQIGGYVMLHDTFPEVCNHVGPRWLLDNLSSVSSARYQWCDLYTAQTNYGLAILRRVE